MLVVNTYKVCLCLCAFIAVKPVCLLEVRGRDLSRVLADLYFRNDLSVIVLYRRQLIDSSEYRIALRRDESFTDSESVDLRPLLEHFTDKVLVKRVGNYDLALIESRIVEHTPCLLRKVGHVA